MYDIDKIERELIASKLQFFFGDRVGSPKYYTPRSGGDGSVICTSNKDAAAPASRKYNGEYGKGKSRRKEAK